MNRELVTLGWREKIALPQLNLNRLRAKVDTGAKTSSLHTFFAEYFDEAGVRKVRFGVHPKQGNTNVEVICEATVVDERNVKNSGGQIELRPVIKTLIVLGSIRQSIEITLTSRDDMKYRMLLGRSALEGHFIVNPEKSYLAGMPNNDLCNWPLTGQSKL